MLNLPPECTMLLAGFAGALVFAFLRPDRASWLRSVGVLMTGTLTSVFTTPALCEWREWASPHAQHAAAFGVGLVGVVCCKAVIGAAENQSVQEWFSAVARRIFNSNGKGKP